MTERANRARLGRCLFPICRCEDGRPAHARITWSEIGRLTQRLEYLVYTEGVGGSNPSSPTVNPLPEHCLRQFYFRLPPHRWRTIRPAGSITRMRMKGLLCASVLVSLAVPAHAADDFAADIRPLLSQYCLKGHSSEQQKGDLDL